MADEVKQPEPTRVMVNGAAVALLNSMFASLKSDLAESEGRLTRQIDERLARHEARHLEELQSLTIFETDAHGRISTLERNEIDETNAKALADARWWLPRSVAVFVARNNKVILALLTGLIGFVLGLSGHIQLTFL